MSRWPRLLIGLVAALLAGWVHYGPLGGGEAFIAALEARARLRVRVTELQGIQVAMHRDPLARVALMSGAANEFQREGMGSYPGLNERVGTVPGIAAVRWPDEGAAQRRVMPLVVEVLALAGVAFLLGLGIGWLLFGRKRRESFLD